MNHALKIKELEDGLLSIKLNDILNLIEGDKYKWSILLLEAIGEPEDGLVLDFEKQINESKSGMLINWENLLKMSTRFSQIVEILLIGDKDPAKLSRYKTDEDMYSNCDYVIELVDSSYWIIHCKDNQSFNIFKNSFQGSESINPDY